MDLFVGIIEDRHTDVATEVFSDEDKAVTWARKMAHDSTSDLVDESLTKSMKDAGWVYCGVYSGEGDKVRVVRRMLNNPTNH